MVALVPILKVLLLMFVVFTSILLPKAASTPLTKAVVANCVVLVPAAAVGAVGIPVKLGLTIVLLVKVSVPAKVAMVPVVGKVISVTPVLVNVVL